MAIRVEVSEIQNGFTAAKIKLNSGDATFQVGDHIINLFVDDKQNKVTIPKGLGKMFGVIGEISLRPNQKLRSRYQAFAWLGIDIKATE